MSIDEVNVEIKIDGLDLAEVAGDSESPDGGKKDSLESVRRDLESLRGEFAAAGVEAANGRKEMSSLRETVTKLKERLDAWQENAEKWQEMTRRLKGVDGPSEATRRKMAIP